MDVSQSMVAGPSAASCIVSGDIPLGRIIEDDVSSERPALLLENFPTTVVSTRERRGSDSQIIIVVPANIAISLYDAMFNDDDDSKGCLLLLLLDTIVVAGTRSVISASSTSSPSVSLESLPL